MKISAKTTYACKALIELSIHWPKTTPLAINHIAQNQKIPIKFLTHILIQLKQLGYVESVRGKKGGYILIKAPKEITLGDVVKGFSDMHLKTDEVNPKNPIDVMDAIWREADRVLLNFIGNIHFEDIKTRYQSISQVPMYTI